MKNSQMSDNRSYNFNKNDTRSYKALTHNGQGAKEDYLQNSRLEEMHNSAYEGYQYPSNNDEEQADPLEEFSQPNTARIEHEEDYDRALNQEMIEKTPEQ